MQRRELRGSPCKITFLVIGKAKIQPELRTPGCLSKSNVILRDRLVETAERNKNDTKVSMRSDYVRVQPNQFLILADGERVIPALLRFRGILEEPFRTRLLRTRATRAKQKKQKHCCTHDF